MKKNIPKGLVLGYVLAIFGSTSIAQTQTDKHLHEHDGHDHHLSSPSALYDEEPAEHLTCVTENDYQTQILPLLQASFATASLMTQPQYSSPPFVRRL